MEIYINFHKWMENLKHESLQLQPKKVRNCYYIYNNIFNISNIDNELDATITAY